MTPQLKSVTSVRVRYAETDRMGFVYYGNYAQYLEVGRVEMLRELGHPYHALEKQGIHLPVRNYTIEYHRPAHYDDVLRIETLLADFSGVRIRFDYRVMNEEGVLICTASTTLVFVDATSGKPCKAPMELVKVLAKIQE